MTNEQEAPTGARRADANGAVSAGSLPRVRYTRPLTQEGGNAYGYTLLVKRLEEAISHDENSKFALTCTTPDRYEPVAGCFNAVLTMWESSTMEKTSMMKLSGADLVIAPSRWVADRAREALPDRVAVEVASLGVDSNVWKFKTRRWPDPEGRPFRWLWNAAPNPRKGWPLVARVWGELFSAVQHTEVYVKTSVPGEGKLVREGNMIFDSRRLPLDELVALYESSHGFLYPSMGEGFGLTVAEAMASGLPCVSTAVTGHGDFVNASNAFIIDTASASVNPKLGRESVADDGTYELQIPMASSCAIQMGRVMSDYASARVKAKRAATLIHSRYTWPLFRKRMAEIVAAYSPDR